MPKGSKASEKVGPLRRDELQAMAVWHRREGKRKPVHTGNHLTHGIFANRFLDEAEKPLFDAVIAALEEDFVCNRSSDFLQVELVGVNFVKLARAFVNGEMESVERIDRMIRQHLRDLKATKLTREGPAEPPKRKTTPADWATSLLERIAEAKIDLSGSDSEKNEEKVSENET